MQAWRATGSAVAPDGEIVVWLGGLLKNDSECFDELSMNGKILMIQYSTVRPFDYSGQALSNVEGLLKNFL